VNTFFRDLDLKNKFNETKLDSLTKPEKINRINQGGMYRIGCRI
jgi:hypothetical protein